ncbi:hypothetical protein P153DRAFT_337627 [Dothidotthia symphoricarpi CBS 119687]|uniref:Knr4/Smi1-like domain-containing protein n=1 Tax=Dothidotthia symphoricarpi CBS 119687 TaxID=1392245 RepID=A0A6A6AGW7_9PLEO|nr:uncharacterized protein P153DRAFT_337627 [Dothidotthia symphoricarpi CBS 119687]KAF2131232.1 hypothetical protein P153DRAFT_337627 [Dothidotthia symphoricarpi CBS 119687]
MSGEANESIPFESADEPIPYNPPFSRAQVLQSSNEDLYIKTAKFAIQFAILGYTDTASELISKLNNHDWYHGRHIGIRPLWQLWDQINHWPDGELDRVRESIKDNRKRAAGKRVKDNQGEETGKKIKLDVDESPITDDDVKKEVDSMYHSYSKSWWYPEVPQFWAYGGVHVPPSPHSQEVDLSIEDLRKKTRDLISAFHGWDEPGKYQDAVKGESPIEPSGALASALELRIRLREKGGGGDDGVPSEDEILSMIAKRLGARSQIHELTQSRRVWPMLNDGALPKILGIDKTKVNLFAEQLVEVVTERLVKGRLSLSELSIKQIVELINMNTLTNPDSIRTFQERDDEAPSTILHDPAPASVVVKTEERLDTKLPDDYKEYLSITNGNEPAFGGIIMEAPLWKCEDIRWFADDEDYFADLCIDIPGDMSSITHEIANDGLDWTKIGRGIIIGQEDIDNTFLIPPATIERVQEKVRSVLESRDEKVTREVKDSVRHAVNDFAGSMEEFNKLEWCCLTWASGGAVQMDGYKSFKAYLRHVAESSGTLDKDLWHSGSGEFFGYSMVD